MALKRGVDCLCGPGREAEANLLEVPLLTDLSLSSIITKSNGLIRWGSVYNLYLFRGSTVATLIQCPQFDEATVGA